MKKILFTFLIMFIGIGMVYSQSITVTSPHSGDTWAKGSTHNVTWTKSGTMDANVKITLYNTAGTTLIEVMTMNTPNDGSYSWTIPVSVAAGNYVVRVKTTDNAVFDDSDVFAISAPESAVINVTSPNSGDTWAKGSTHNVTWTKSGTMDANVKITLYNTAGTTLIEVMTMNTPNDGSYSWTIPGSVAAGNYVVRVKTTDNAVSDDSSIFSVNTGVTEEPSSSCSPFEVYKPVKNSSHWIGFNMDIKWKNKMMVMKKIISPVAGAKVATIVKPDMGIVKLKMVKIEIKSVKCISIMQFKDKLKILYLKEKVPMQKIEFLMKMPWVFQLPQWKTVATTIDDGSYTWKVPFSYKKGCYVIKVTKLWCSASDSDRVAISKSFKLVPLVLGTVQMELFKKKSKAVELIEKED